MYWNFKACTAIGKGITGINKEGEIVQEYKGNTCAGIKKKGKTYTGI